MEKIDSIQIPAMLLYFEDDQDLGFNPGIDKI